MASEIFVNITNRDDIKRFTGLGDNDVPEGTIFQLGPYVTSEEYKEAQRGIAALEACLAALEWIRVDDRLPDCPHETGGGYSCSADVLIQTKDGTLIGSYCVSEKQWNDWSGSRVIGVTHWQPLPDAPAAHPGAQEVQK